MQLQVFSACGLHGSLPGACYCKQARRAIDGREGFAAPSVWQKKMIDLVLVGLRVSRLAKRQAYWSQSALVM